MTELKDCFQKQGYKNVKSYINSGNIIFETNEVDVEKLERQIEKSIEDTFTLKVKVLIRTKPQMEKLIEEIPKYWVNNDSLRRNVIFLREEINDPSIIDGLNPKPDIESVAYRDGVLFWAAKTSNLTKSSMVKLSQKNIYKEMTIRNENTTRKIYELMTIVD